MSHGATVTGRLRAIRRPPVGGRSGGADPHRRCARFAPHGTPPEPGPRRARRDRPETAGVRRPAPPQATPRRGPRHRRSRRSGRRGGIGRLTDPRRPGGRSPARRPGNGSFPNTLTVRGAAPTLATGMPMADLDLPTGTVTFLFTDLGGSTRLLEAHPEAYRAAARRHHALLRGTVESHGGVVFETVGTPSTPPSPRPPTPSPPRWPGNVSSRPRTGARSGAPGAVTGRPGSTRRPDPGAAGRSLPPTRPHPER
jgi:hypothetical protein